MTGGIPITPSLTPPLTLSLTFHHFLNCSLLTSITSSPLPILRKTSSASSALNPAQPGNSRTAEGRGGWTWALAARPRRCRTAEQQGLNMSASSLANQDPPHLGETKPALLYGRRVHVDPCLHVAPALVWPLPLDCPLDCPSTVPQVPRDCPPRTPRLPRGLPLDCPSSTPRLPLDCHRLPATFSTCHLDAPFLPPSDPHPPTCNLDCPSTAP